MHPSQSHSEVTGGIDRGLLGLELPCLSRVAPKSGAPGALCQT